MGGLLAVMMNITGNLLNAGDQVLQVIDKVIEVLREQGKFIIGCDTQALSQIAFTAINFYQGGMQVMHRF